MELHAEIVVAKGTVPPVSRGCNCRSVGICCRRSSPRGKSPRAAPPTSRTRGQQDSASSESPSAPCTRLQHVLQLLGPEPAEVGHLLPLPETQAEGHLCNLSLLINYCQRVDQLDRIHEVNVDDAAPGLVEMHLFKCFEGEAAGEGSLTIPRRARGRVSRL
jgi:hypothetical protein